ncbi:PREDICTED: NADH dehydrogenase [ubiquinone] 1 alpha subcomplex subunit 12 isoform X1 [Gavialis gangeticus]|uniref:NADH dehydrogenase [ubiquinone] 1 alpha subcomplex subunit 12 isoform X1 n=1 Tax=Gavialis gangeticus TaxID=94835 RepID=UPI00092E6B64|nr:PREDICTED: NADH dehydrogenase [ubiquinone] 1 alpha subcomplex subunit 12 isoform X1 [Gavialis gangeticus]
MAEYLQVLRNALRQLGGHGGVRGAIWKVLRVSDLKIGTLIGVDKYGNKYFEDKRYFFGLNACLGFWEFSGSLTLAKGAVTYWPQKECPFWSVHQPQGRHRWVEYTSEMNGKNTYWDVDASMVPPEWHRWLHSMTDDPPTTHPPVARKFIWENHKFNLSGSSGQYVPYSTTRKKIQEWIPPATASK